MTTTYLYIENMIVDKAISDVKRILSNIGFKVVAISKGEARLEGDYLSGESLKIIKHELQQNGYELRSVCQTIWLSKSEGINIL